MNGKKDKEMDWTYNFEDLIQLWTENKKELVKRTGVTDGQKAKAIKKEALQKISETSKRLKKTLDLIINWSLLFCERAKISLQEVKEKTDDKELHSKVDSVFKIFGCETKRRGERIIVFLTF